MYDFFWKHLLAIKKIQIVYVCFVFCFSPAHEPLQCCLQRKKKKNQPLKFRWPWHPAGSLVLLWFFHPVRFSLMALSFSHFIFLSFLSPAQISCCQRNSNTFCWVANTEVRWDLQKKKKLNLFSFQVGGSAVTECADEPEPRLPQECKKSGVNFY